jgi:hypothetical protein
MFGNKRTYNGFEAAAVPSASTSGDGPPLKRVRESTSPATSGYEQTERSVDLGTKHNGDNDIEYDPDQDFDDDLNVEDQGEADPLFDETYAPFEDELEDGPRSTGHEVSRYRRQNLLGARRLFWPL